MIQTTKTKNSISYAVLIVLLALLSACGGGLESTDNINNAIPIQKPDLKAPDDIRYTEYDGKIQLSWASVKGATHYKLFLSTSPGIDTKNPDLVETQIFDTILKTEIILSDIEKNTPYYAVLSSTNSEGEIVSSPEFKLVLTVDSIGLSLVPPNNFTASQEEGVIKLSWDPLPEAINYILYYSESDVSVSPLDARQIQEIASSDFKFVAENIESEYYFRLSAMTPAGQTPLTNVVSEKPGGFIDTPAAPENFSASSADALVALKWNKTKNASRYNVYLSKDPLLSTSNYDQLNAGEKIAGITSLSTNRLGLDNDETYYFLLTAENNIGESKPSPLIAATPRSFLPSVPSNVQAEPAFESIKLSWSPVDDATRYTVYWSTSANATRITAQRIDNITGTEFVHENLTSNDVIYYFVTANSQKGESENSATAAASPIVSPEVPSVPIDIIISQVSGSVTFSWDAIAGAQSYNLYLATEPGISKDNYFQLKNGTRLRFITATSFDTSRLIANTRYYVRLSAVNEGGEGDLSDEISFKTNMADGSDSTPPELTGIDDLIQSGAELDVNNTFNFTFSEALDPLSIDTNTVYISEVNGAKADTVVSLNKNLLTIATSSALKYSTKYEIVIQNVRDLAGNAIANAQQFQFTTITPADLQPPTNLAVTAQLYQNTITWTANPNGGLYAIYRSTSFPVTTSDLSIGATSADFFEDKQVIAGTTYYYAVLTSIDNGNGVVNGPLSDSVQVTAGVPLNTISFSDANLEACVLSTGNLYIEQLTSLNCEAQGVADLLGIESLKSLAVINLSNNNISDISLLANLASLVDLDLRNNFVTKINSLTGLSKLKNIWLSGNQIGDVSPLLSLTAVTTIELKDIPNLSCTRVLEVDKQFDASDGASAGAVSWTTCLNGVIDFNQSTINGWVNNGLAAGDTGVIHEPNPTQIKWDDSTDFNRLPGTDIIDNVGSLQLFSDNFSLPPSFPAGTLWSVDLISPDLTDVPEWQVLTDLSMAVANLASNGIIYIQPLLNATRKSDGVATFLREVDATGAPVFYTIKQGVNWDQSVTPVYGDLSGYIINNFRIRVFGEQTSGALSLNFDEIVVNPVPAP